MKPSTKWIGLLLLGLVVSTRLWMVAQAPSAFGFEPGDVHPDQGVVVLMAKHILEGGEFPVFHYGQAYLGSLEAFMLSSCYLVFGINLWVIHIVPVVCYTFFSFLLFLLARDLSGTPTGLWALLWCIFAPITLSEYSVMPQVGNISAPMFGTALLCLTIKSLKTSDHLIKRSGYALLGLLAGIGWWTSPMLIYYLFTIPLFILLKEPWREILKGGSWGVVLFFVGALPFFCYYAIDPQLRVLGMGEGYSLKNLKEGLPLFFLERIHYFLDLDKFFTLHPVYLWLGAFIYLGAVVFLFWKFRRDLGRLFRPGSWSEISPGFLVVLFFLIFVGTLSSSSHIQRNAARYFFPLASFFPIALACWATLSPQRWRLIPMGLCLLLFFVQGVAGWRFIRDQAPSAESATKTYIKVAQTLEAKGDREIYAWQNPGSELINFYTRERVISSRPMGERYRPYEDRLEASVRPAFLDPGDKDIRPSLKVIGGSCHQEKLETYQVYSRFRPPGRAYREIPREGFRIEASDEPGLVRKMIDRRLDTGWSSGRSKTPHMWLKIDLGKPYSLGMVRLVNPGDQHGNYSLALQVETSLDGLHWDMIIPETRMDFYYWDGPRIYFWELNYHWACRVGPLKARYVKITNKEAEERFPWKVGELYVYEDQGEQDADPPDTRFMVEKINRLGLKKVYAGRWLSAKIKEATQGRTKTVQTFTYPSFDRWPQSRVVTFGPGTGFLVERQDQPGFEELLAAENIRPVQETLGRWNLYYFREWGQKEKQLETHRGFWWTGFGILKVGPEVWQEFHRRRLEEWS